MTTLEATGYIVVGTDGSKRARGAIDWAAEVAQGRGLPLLIVQTVSEFPIPSRTGVYSAMIHGGLPEEILDSTRRSLAREARRVRKDRPGLTVDETVIEGRASYVLARASKTAELVVVGARGVGVPLKVRALGGTSDAVATHAHGPVAIIPDEGDPTPDGPVLVGVDDSEESRAAIRLAVSAARRRGVPLIALHAWTTPWLDGEAATTFKPDDLERSFEGLVERLVRPYVDRAPGLDLEIRVVNQRPASALVEASTGCSLVLVGSRGRDGFAGLLLGSTSRGLLRDAHCPVIVMRRGAQLADDISDPTGPDADATPGDPPR